MLQLPLRAHAAAAGPGNPATAAQTTKRLVVSAFNRACAGPRRVYSQAGAQVPHLAKLRLPCPAARRAKLQRRAAASFPAALLAPLSLPAAPQVYTRMTDTYQGLLALGCRLRSRLRRAMCNLMLVALLAPISLALGACIALLAARIALLAAQSLGTAAQRVLTRLLELAGLGQDGCPPDSKPMVCWLWRCQCPGLGSW